VSEPSTSSVEGARTHPLTALVQGTVWAGVGVIGLVNAFTRGDSFGPFSDLLAIVAAVAGGLLIGLIAGFFRWYFTRFFIDGSELRIESGVLFRTSRRIPYERLQSVDIDQPFVARLIGLCELHMEMAGGSESRSTLRFLPLSQADELRRLLLARAHGTAADEAALVADERREPIVVLAPGRIIIGTVLSLDFQIAVVVIVTLGVAGLAIPDAWAVLGGIIPSAAWLAQIIVRRVIAQWNFTLSRGSRGLRIERGLLSRSSQTIPYERVQGVAVVEPLIWRRFGWRRLLVDVAGYGASSDEENGVSDTTLLPISDGPLARAICEELIPGSDPDAVEPVRVSSRSWPLAPIGWRFRWVGASDLSFIARTGWISRTTAVMPHRKTQSVALRQGPLQRWLGVATVEVHTPPGPVDARGRHLNAGVARTVAERQIVRAR